MQSTYWEIYYGNDDDNHIITIMLFKGWQVSQQDSLGNWGWIGEPGVKVAFFLQFWTTFTFWIRKEIKTETGEKTKEKLVNGRQKTHDLVETLTLMLRFWAGVLSRRTSRWRKPAFQPFSYGLQSPGRHRSKEAKDVLWILSPEFWPYLHNFVCVCFRPSILFPFPTDFFSFFLSVLGLLHGPNMFYFSFAIFLFLRITNIFLLQIFPFFVLLFLKFGSRIPIVYLSSSERCSLVKSTFSNDYKILFYSCKRGGFLKQGLTKPVWWKIITERETG